MRKRSNDQIVEICKQYALAFNQFCRDHQKDEFMTRKELEKKLSGIIPKNIFSELIKMKVIMAFPTGDKRRNVYRLPEEPVNVKEHFIPAYHRASATQKKYDETYRSTKHIDKAIKLLRENGYEVIKIKGFDFEGLKKSYPDLYQKYLITEKV